MQHHVVEHRAQGVLGALVLGGQFHRLADGDAQAARMIRILRQDRPPGFGKVGWRGHAFGAVGAHQRLAVGFLLERHLDLEHLHLQIEQAAGEGQRRAPLAGAGLGGEPLDGGPWVSIKNPRTGGDIVIKDVIADAMLQQVLTRPRDYSVVATLNLNGDYLSDALAAQVGGIGIAPGANLSDTVALFEATHGTAPKYAGQDKVNPGSLILSAEMMLRHLGWNEAADLIIDGMNGAIQAKTVTYDFERLMDGATLVSCSAFGDAIISHM